MNIYLPASSRKILEDLFELAYAPTLSVVSLCGIAGSGKTTLAESLRKVHGINAVVVPLDAWMRETTKVRKARVADAHRSGDEDAIAAAEDAVGYYDFDKFYYDLSHLRNRGSLTLKNTYDKASGELTGTLDITLPHSRPRLIMVEGSRLLHEPVRYFADYSICLDVTRAAAEKRRSPRDAAKYSPEELVKWNEIHWRNWEAYRAKSLTPNDHIVNDAGLTGLTNSLPYLTPGSSPHTHTSERWRTLTTRAMLPMCCR
jgi:uridine kinase